MHPRQRVGLAVLGGSSRGSCGAGGRAQGRRGRAPWGQAKGEACGHSPALACLVAGRLRQAAALPGLGILSPPPPAAAPAGTLQGWTMLIPRPALLLPLFRKGRMGTVPSSARGSPRYPRLGRKVLPAALGRAGSFSGQRWILGPSHPDLVCVGYLPARGAMLLPAAQAGHRLGSLRPLQVC